AQNVARGFKIKAGNETQRKSAKLRAGEDFPSRSELRTLIDAATGQRRALLITAVFTGMRASELRGLPRANVDLENAVIKVTQRADAWGRIGDPKSKAGNRDIPLTPMVVNTLSEWRLQYSPPILRHDDEGRPVRENAKPQHLVFPNGSGHVENHSNILHRFWEPLQIECGIAVDTGRKDDNGKPILEARYGFHMLRHAAASLLIAHLGWTPKRVQEVMGHSSITMTFDRYGHLFEDRDGDREAMQKLEAAVVAA